MKVRVRVTDYYEVELDDDAVCEEQDRVRASMVPEFRDLFSANDAMAAHIERTIDDCGLSITQWLRLRGTFVGTDVDAGVISDRTIYVPVDCEQ